MRFRHIIWDWNGTLLDDAQAGVHAVNGLLADRDLPLIDLPTYRETFGFPVRDFYRTLGFRLEHEDWDALARDYHSRFLAQTSLRLHDHAADLLARFRADGIGQSILSASEQGILDGLLAQFGIAHLFDAVCGTDNLYGHSKGALGRALLTRLALPPSAILLVGDSLHDHEVARDLGTGCLLIAQGHQSHARLARSGAPVLDSLVQLPAWLAAAQ